MQVYVAAIDGAAALNTLSVLDTMTKSNSAWRHLGDPSAPDLFTVRACGPDGGDARFHGGVTLPGTFDPVDDPTPDLVVVPGLDDDVESSLERNRGWIPHLRRWHAGGATISSSCTGTFLLGAAGLLDGRRATTHWVAADALASAFPRVDVRRDAVVVDEGDVITSGGATTAFNLVLYLVGRFGGRDRANAATRLMLLDAARTSQQPFALTGVHRQHDDPIVHDAQSAVQDGRVAPLTVAALAREIGVSPRTLTRRFRAALDLTPQAYIEEARVDAARRLLEETGLAIDDLRSRVGFSDPTSFRRAFKRRTGLTPGEYRQRYARHSAPADSDLGGAVARSEHG